MYAALFQNTYSKALELSCTINLLLCHWRSSLLMRKMYTIHISTYIFSAMEFIPHQYHNRHVPDFCWKHVQCEIWNNRLSTVASTFLSLCADMRHLNCKSEYMQGKNFSILKRRDPRDRNFRHIDVSQITVKWHFLIYELDLMAMIRVRITTTIVSSGYQQKHATLFNFGINHAISSFVRCD